MSHYPVAYGRYFRMGPIFIETHLASSLVVDLTTVRCPEVGGAELLLKGSNGGKALFVGEELLDNGFTG